MGTKNISSVLWTAAVATSVLVSCSLFDGLKGGKTRSRGPKVFSHFIHTSPDEEDLDCEECHAEASEKAEAGMPVMETCTECHDEPEDAGEVEKKAFEVLNARAKAGVPLWGKKTEHDLVFDHSKHANVTYVLKSGQSVKIECSDCHGDAGSSKDLPRETTPPMKLCTDCHERGKPPSSDGTGAVSGAELNACSKCHETHRRDERPADHRGLWRVVHGEEIGFGFDEDETERCEYCHTEGFCVKCHQQEKPRSHTQSFRLRTHGIDASMDRERCATCHLEDTCVRCHRDTRPLDHRAGSWAVGVYRHCTGCHVPVGMTRCGACHKSATHSLAPNYPRDSNHTGSCLMSCHMKQHPDSGAACTSCHK